uniref:uncharacterized protein LOC113475420 n=1 Tax=Ciona intestinalis TaxID=7719 RepID=UPI000521C378|nr:uncharacterized protein LOC113475420 [Ciona intestinalis]|eukprot:XP_026695390.1 uncharacterized protein LOC113475420 [Ciona intestinalis]
MEKVAKLIQEQLKQQQERHDEQQVEQQRRHDELQEEQQRRHEQQMKMILTLVEKAGSGETATSSVAIPSFTSFDSTSELWHDYWSRFTTFTRAHAVPETRVAQVFLTNQTTTTYKLLFSVAGQSSPVKTVNDLSIEDIETFMKQQFDPKRFVIRERFKFWSNMQRKPGETVQELAARIRQDAGTCDFPSIQNPLDEALRTRFICSISNEAVLKPIFKVNADELTFTRAVEIATQAEEAAKVAKETVYGTRAPVHKVREAKKTSVVSPAKKQAYKKKIRCYRCGKADHLAPACHYKTAKCNYCKNVGHVEAVCRTKQQASVDNVKVLRPIKQQIGSNKKLEVIVGINGKECMLEMDTATNGNFISVETWRKVGKPRLKQSTRRFNSATEQLVPIVGAFEAKVQYGTSEK